jgi:hypothetical protein
MEAAVLVAADVVGQRAGFREGHLVLFASRSPEAHLWRASFVQVQVWEWVERTWGWAWASEKVLFSWEQWQGRRRQEQTLVQFLAVRASPQVSPV